MKAFCQAKVITRVLINATKEIGVYAGCEDFGAIVLVHTIREGYPVIVRVAFEETTEL